MKLFLQAVCLLLISVPVLAFEDVDRGQLSQEMLNEALSNPRRYHFDDGGNIDFGNGFFKRRFDFAGRPQVCREGNYLYGGTGRKCMFWVQKKKCGEYKTVVLKTQMKGVKNLCNGNDRSDEEVERQIATSDFRCGSSSKVKFSKGPKVKVKVYRKRDMNGKANGGYIGYAMLTIPRCN